MRTRLQTRTITCRGCGASAVVHYRTNSPKHCAECAATRVTSRELRDARFVKNTVKAGRTIAETGRPALVRYAGFDPTERN